MDEQSNTSPNENTDQSANSGKKWGIGIVVVAIAVVAFVALTGFFVVPPIGAVPGGATIW